MNQLFSEVALSQAFVVLIKLGISVLLGGAIGYERERHGRPAGLRTHILVALGVTLFCLVSTSYVGADPTRISAQVVTGIGFLGAGTIMRLGAEIKGLTSAASIWATSAIAMAVARGDYYLDVAIVATVLTLVTLVNLEKLELKLKPKVSPGEMVVTFHLKSGVHDLLEKFSYEGIEVASIRTIQTDGDTVKAAFTVSAPRMLVMQLVSTQPFVIQATWTDAA